MADQSSRLLNGGAGEGRHGYGKRWFAKWPEQMSLKKFYSTALVLTWPPLLAAAAGMPSRVLPRHRLQVHFSPRRPRGVQPGSGTCREHNCGGGGWYRGLKGEQGASEAGSSRIWRLILKLIAAVCRFDGGCVKRRLFRRPLTSCGPGATTAEVRGSGIGAVSPSAFGAML